MRNTKKKHGFDERPVLANVYFDKEWEVVMTVHGDAFLAVGRSADLDKVDRMMSESYWTKGFWR